MSDGTETPAENDTNSGIQQIPLVMATHELPAAATDARDKLLAAIAAEAQEISSKHPGQGSTALEELARAYALVTSTPAATTPVPAGAPALSIENGKPKIHFVLAAR